MNRPEQPAEPTMEEILASIRRAIDEDTRLDNRLAKTDAEAAESAAAAAEAPAASDDKSSSGSDVLELRRPAAEGARAAKPASPFSASVRHADNDTTTGDVMRASTPRQPYGAPANDRTAAPSQDTGEDEDTPLLAAETDAAVAAAFRELSDTLASRIETDAMVEDAARAMLRPMLKEWLDANLPGLVERLVREEIRRISERDDGARKR